MLSTSLSWREILVTNVCACVHPPICLSVCLSVYLSISYYYFHLSILLYKIIGMTAYLNSQSHEQANIIPIVWWVSLNLVLS